MTDPRDDGTHMVHREDCQFLPAEDNRKALGDAAQDETALDRARDRFGKVKGCATCCTD